MMHFHLTFINVLESLRSNSYFTLISCPDHFSSYTRHPRHSNTCPTTIDSDIANGYNCHPSVSHSWGQYSPYFAVPNRVDGNQINQTSLEDCKITMVNVLARHGARDPTFGKSVLYQALIEKLQDIITTHGIKLRGKYIFLNDYEYTLGSDQLTAFGKEELFNLGWKIFNQYGSKNHTMEPFLRTTSQERVEMSARYWAAGYEAASRCKDVALEDLAMNDCRPDGKDHTDPEFAPHVIIDEDNPSNNTLSHGLCTAFEFGNASSVGSEAAAPFLLSFTEPIARRMNKEMQLDTTDFELGALEVLYLMDLCPFETVATFNASHAASYILPQHSKFCHLFTEVEWEQYGYYQSLTKFYGYGPGNSLGPTQGVGYVNELIARLTQTPVKDHTNTNSTLDGNNATFPLDRVLYADFSHDNDMLSIFSALRLFDTTAYLDKYKVMTPEETGGFSAAWAVPFSARLVVEKMQCPDSWNGQEKEQVVRVVMNDRVVPLWWCGGDQLGMCTVSKFVEGLKWARKGGDWERCWEKDA